MVGFQEEARQTTVARSGPGLCMSRDLIQRRVEIVHPPYSYAVSRKTTKKGESCATYPRRNSSFPDPPSPLTSVLAMTSELLSRASNEIDFAAETGRVICRGANTMGPRRTEPCDGTCILKMLSKLTLDS